TGDSDILKSQAADDWLALLEAFDQPHRSGVVRAAADTMFFGATAETLAAEGDALTDRIAETIREWAAHARERGVAAVFEAAQLNGMTDLAHVAQLLQEAAHNEHFSLPALRDWLCEQREERSNATERYRRLDSDAAAVQIMTVFGAKGLQFPIVYLPFTFNRNVQDHDIVLYHDNDERCLYVGGKGGPNFNPVVQQARAEDASDDSRLTYVALTRAQSQVVAWWSPAWDEYNGGLSRVLRGRRPGEVTVPAQCDPRMIADEDAMALLREWEAAGGLVIEDSVVASLTPLPVRAAPSELGVRHFHRGIDTQWRRTSYSGLIRVTETTPVSSEPEVV